MENVIMGEETCVYKFTPEAKRNKKMMVTVLGL
jgi:hypothetical protein